MIDQKERVFMRHWNLRDAFRAFFGAADPTAVAAPDVERVMADLTSYCYATESCVQHDKEGRVDALATARAEGRREVLLRIEQWLALTDAELFRLRRVLNPDDIHEETS